MTSDAAMKFGMEYAYAVIIIAYMICESFDLIQLLSSGCKMTILAIFEAWEFSEVLRA